MSRLEFLLHQDRHPRSRPFAALGLFIDAVNFGHYIVHVMKSNTYPEAREKLSEIIERVCEDHQPCIITERRDKAVVMMSLEDFDSLKETAYLLKSPKNARRLLLSESPIYLETL